MTTIPETQRAIQHVLDVRDKEREGEASTEDLLDAITGLEDIQLHQNRYSDSDVQELVLSLDLAYSELLKATEQFAPCSGGGDPKVQLQQLRAAIGSVMAGLSENNRFYSDEPRALAAVRYALRERGYEAQYPLMVGEEAYVAIITVEELALIEPDLKRLRDQEEEFEVEVEATTESIPNSVTPLMQVTVRRREPKWSEAEARTFLMQAEQGDRWTEKHDEAAKVLGLDPDNYRARPEGVEGSENWGEENRGRVTEPAALRIHIQRLRDGGKIEV